jgi:Zn-dependent oligopeptidase
MVKTKQKLSDQEINKIKNEMYCAACGKSYYKEGLCRGRLTLQLEQHRKTKKHIENTYKYYIDLEKQFTKKNINDSNSKLDIDIDDDNFTSISSILKITEIDNKLNEVSDTQSLLLSNQREQELRTMSLSEIVANQPKKENLSQLQTQVDKLTTEITKLQNKDRNVTFDQHDDTKTDMHSLLLEHGKLINSNIDLCDIVKTLKLSCKELMKLSSNNQKLSQLLLKQYTILDKHIDDGNSRSILSEFYSQMIKLSIDHL